MNLPNWIRLKEWLEKQPDEAWDMSTYTDDCGTAYCLAGHAVAMSGLSPKELEDGWWKSVNNPDVPAVAAEILGLDDDDDDESESEHVFGGGWIERDWDDIKRADAIRYLELAIAAQDPMVSLDSDPLVVDDDICDLAAPSVEEGQG